MTFASPWVLTGLLLLVPLVALHLRDRGHPPREVPSLVVWRQLGAFATHGIHGRRLSGLPLLLILQAAALILLVVALAQPRTTTATRPPGRVVVIDDSLWMSAPGRLPEARRAAMQIVNSAPSGAEISLVRAGGAPLTLYRGTAAGAHAVLARLRPTAAPADLAAALSVASGLLEGSHDQIAVIRAPEDRMPPTRASRGELRDTTVGARLTDQGIFDASARCGIGSPATCEVYATVVNRSGRTVDDSYTADAAGRSPLAGQVRLAAGASAEVTLLATPGEQLTLRLAGHDAIAADNAAAVAVPGVGGVRRGTVVTLVGSRARSLALAQALVSIPGVRVRLAKPSDYSPADARTSTLVVLDGWLPKGPLPAAPGLLLVDPPRLPGGGVGGALADTVVSGTDATSQLLADVDLSSLDLDRGAARRLSLPSWLTPVVWSPSGTLLAAGDNGRQRLAVFDFEPARSNLPQLSGFPVLVSNIVDWASRWTPPSATAGTRISVDTTPLARTAALARDGHVLARYRLHGGPVSFAAPMPGFYTVTERGPGIMRRASLAVTATQAAPAGPSPVDLRASSARRPALRQSTTPSSLTVWFLAGALAMLVIEALYWMARRQRALAAWRRLRRASRRPSLAIIAMCGAPVLVVVALFDPHVGVRSQPPTVLAVDSSASISARGRAVERQWVRDVRRDDCAKPCRIVRFAGTTVTDAAATNAARSDTAGSSTAASSTAASSTAASSTAASSPTASSTAASSTPAAGAAIPDAGATNLQSAVQTAIGMLPRGGRVVVLSDGGQTEGDLLGEVAEARARHVRIDWVRLPGPARPDAAITALSVPQTVRRGDPVPLTVTIHSDVPGRAVLQISSGYGAPRKQSVELRAGDNPLLLFYTADNQGWQSFKATIALPGDVQPRNDSMAASTDVLAAPRVLTIANGASQLAAQLTRAGVDDTTAAPSALPANASGYRGLDAVVLDDVSAKQLRSAQISALSEAVRRNGVGLFVVGGPQSLSLGSYAKTGLQHLLPVRSLVPGNVQRRNVAIELVLDHSGSMIDEAGGVPKIEMAHVAANDSAAFIVAHKDQLGVVDFDIRSHVIVPLERLSSRAAGKRVEDTVDGIRANGGTNIFLGLKAGYEQLLRSHAPERHIILMTDGISQPENYAPLLAQLRRAHITVATVALGSDADRQLLARISKGTGGHTYATDDAKQLPKIFAKETQLSAKPVRVRGHLSVTASGDSPVIRSLVGATLPGLRGNVVTTLNPGAQADLIASDAKGRTDPALAEWQIGAGRVLVWTPGIRGPWASAWAGEHALWSDAVHWVQRAPAPPVLIPQPLAGRDGVLQVDASGEGAAGLGLAGITGTLTDEGGVSLPVQFTPVGPGLFQANVGAYPPGLYHYQLVTQGSLVKTVNGEVAIEYPHEYSPATSSVSPLGQLVAQTRGRVLAPARRAAIRASADSLRRLLALLALVIFAIGVTLRMLPRLLRGEGDQPAEPTWKPAQPEWGSSSDSERALSSSSVSGSTEVGTGT